MGFFNGLSNGCGYSSSTNWWWIIIILLLIDGNNTCDSLIWLLLLSRFCGNGEEGASCGCARSMPTSGCGCGC